MNLENFSLRDKILFNPTLQVKRATPAEQLARFLTAVEDLLKKDHRVETGPSPIRISSLSAASFAVEVFAYVLTPDINEFYRVEADLYLQMNNLLGQIGIELS